MVEPMYEVLTPAMQQYVDLKKQYSDCILFFRLGDFYEVFFEDARVCSNLLDLVLTSKNKKADNPIPMAGMPYHSVEKYIEKLIQYGHKVAIAEQTSEAIPGQLVKREVKQVFTPGTYIYEDKPSFTYVCALSHNSQGFHLAWGDFGLGHYYTKSFSDPQKLQKFLLTISPSECIFSSSFTMRDPIESVLESHFSTVFAIYDVPRNPQEFIGQVVNVQTIASFGQALTDGREDAFALLAYYLYFTQKAPLHTLQFIRLHNSTDLVLLDEVTVKNLEIFHASYEHDVRYSLFGVINNTKTSAGARMLQFVLQHPTQNLAEITKRLDFVEYFRRLDSSRQIHQYLGYICDIQKTLGTIVYRKTLPALFSRLRATLKTLLYTEDSQTGNNVFVEQLVNIGMSKDVHEGTQIIYDFLCRVFHDDDKLHNDKDFVRDGYDSLVDELRKMAYHSDEILFDYQRLIQEKTGLSCKLKFVLNQGYFVEVSQKDVKSFESFVDQEDEHFDFSRRHTLKAAQRYSSTYLDTVQVNVLASKDKLVAREQELLEEAKNFLLLHQHQLSAFADICARLDVYVSHALLTIDKKLSRPVLTTESVCTIQDGRHLVIEEFLPRDQGFIPNDLAIGDSVSGSVHIITGPNMGGKSTFLRQNALIVLMAHCGLYVPATSARIGLVDGIFARVGSGDIIAKNQSTFMTEMIEVANILHNATASSFVIFDELGRGTSTYDGIALTKTILEYLVHKIGCRTLLATHYHELVSLELEYDQIRNFSVSVYENDKDVVFLKKIVPGGANKSYGIDVAKLAGIPDAIIQKARTHLSTFEKKQSSESYHSQPLFVVEHNTSSSSLPDDYATLKILQAELEAVHIDTLTPVDALLILQKLKKHTTGIQ